MSSGIVTAKLFEVSHSWEVLQLKQSRGLNTLAWDSSNAPKAFVGLKVGKKEVK